MSEMLIQRTKIIEGPCGPSHRVQNVVAFLLEVERVSCRHETSYLMHTAGGPANTGYSRVMTPGMMMEGKSGVGAFRPISHLRNPRI